ncbi:MAG: hypothetical protein KF784_00685 [Fimbriimonadaceae bacterium]|nr:hypothetical protein [Fimbriimonadaceae bacterium]
MTDTPAAVPRIFSPLWLITLSLIAIGGSWVFAGWQGGVGMGAGIVGTSFNLWALWRICIYIGEIAADNPQPRVATFVTIFVFLLKLPILIGLGLAMQRVGGPAMPCFLIGLGMVYFALVGWALARR